MTKICRGALGFSAVIAFALFATAGWAAGPSEAEKRASCTDDVMRFCFSKIGNNDRIEGCLRARRPQLSGKCKALFDKYDSTAAQTATSAARLPTTTQAGVSDAGPAITQPAKEANEKPANERPASEKSASDKLAGEKPASEKPANEKSATPASMNSMLPMMSGMPPMAKGMLSMAKGMPAMMKKMPAMMPAMMRNMPGM
jgi:hypothetical protein